MLAVTSPAKELLRSVEVPPETALRLPLAASMPAPVEHALSTAAQCTPPCTMP